MAILDAAFQFGSHPTYAPVGNSTRRPLAQLRISGQGPCLGFYQVKIIIKNPSKCFRRVRGMYPNPIISSCIQGHCEFFVLPRRHPAYSLRSSSSSSRHRTYRRFIGAGVVPILRSRRCTRIFRLAIATNITFSRPGVVVGLVLKPKSSLNDSMAVTWLSPGSTSRCTSLAILWQSALALGGTSNDAPFRISWSLARVRR